MLMVPAHTRRYRRFADALTGARARLAEKRGWLVLSFQRTFTAYLVPVSLAHSRRSSRRSYPFRWTTTILDSVISSTA